MKALAITPKKAYSAKIIDVPLPAFNDNEVLVKVLEAGVCTTDREIYAGLYGEAPQNGPYLIMGHESIGVIEAVGDKVSGLKKGDCVVRTVRRQCTDFCLNCRNNEQDMCLTGKFTETGIKGLHGVMTEYYADNPQNLVLINPEDRDVGVLLEPLSFAVKTIAQAISVQERMSWDLKKALVIGAGPIGLLEAFILKAYDVDVDVAAKSKPGNLKSRLVKEIGARYIPADNINTLKKYNLIIESSGDSSNIWDGVKHLENNGVMCLTSITAGNKVECYWTDSFNLNMVLGNKIILGVVNSNISDYIQGAQLFSLFKKKWPKLLEKLITRRVCFSESLDVASLFKKESDDIKVVLEQKEGEIVNEAKS